MDYNVTLKKEVLTEMIAYLQASFQKYMRANSIDRNDTANSIAVSSKRLNVLRTTVFTDCRNLNDLQNVQNELQQLRTVIES